jgi:hypothetical protein
MTAVFLIGAGFSKEASASMPLLGELTAEVRKQADLSFLPEFGDSIELWLTYLSQPHPWLSEPDNLRNRALFIDITRTIRDVLGQREVAATRGRDCPEWLTKLTKRWHEDKAAVITLNYDTLIERAAGLISDPSRNNSFLSPENLYPIAMTELRRRNAMVFGAESIDSFKLFKLHGSVNWYYSGALSYFGELIYYGHVDRWGLPSDREFQSVLLAKDKVPLIVPPTSEKSAYFQHESLRATWSQASLALQEASVSRLYCIGYSLPETDLGIRFFLLYNKRRSTPIPLYVVNTDKQAIGRYRRLLGDAYHIKDNYLGADALKKLVSDLCG